MKSVIQQLRWMFDMLMECQLTDVNAIDDGWTALHWAAEMTDAYYTTRLCAHEDIDINVQANRGWSPIMFAAINNRASSASVLLAQPQLDLSLRRVDGQTALDIANNISPAVATLIQNELARRDNVVRIRILRIVIDEMIAAAEQDETPLADEASALDRLSHVVGVSSEALVGDLGIGVLAFTVPPELFRTIACFAFGELAVRETAVGGLEV